MAIAAAIFAVLNALDEEMDPDLVMQVSFSWSIGPLVILIVYLLSVRMTRNTTTNDTEAIVLSFLYMAAYAYYAFNGPSWRNGPNNAAHMHLILVPMMLGLPAFLIALYMLWRTVRTVRRAKHGHAIR